MARKISISYNEPGIRSIMKGNGIAELEQQMMQQKLAQIKAEFLQSFGTEGNFEIKAVVTRSKRSRLAYRIKSADTKTTALLKRNPGWLARFL